MGGTSLSWALLFHILGVRCQRSAPATGAGSNFCSSVAGRILFSCNWGGIEIAKLGLSFGGKVAFFFAQKIDKQRMFWHFGGKWVDFLWRGSCSPFFSLFWPAIFQFLGSPCQSGKLSPPRQKSEERESFFLVFWLQLLIHWRRFVMICWDAMKDHFFGVKCEDEI